VPVPISERRDQDGIGNEQSHKALTSPRPVRLPGQKVPKVNELMEIETMLAERVKEWTREWKEEGIQLGLQKGRQEGRQEGLCQALKLLLVRPLETYPNGI